MTEFYWDVRAFLWGLCHPFATVEQRKARAIWAMKRELYGKETPNG